MTRLTREEAIQLVGDGWVDEVEQLNCEPTRWTDFDDTEWSASVKITDYDGLSEAQIDRLPVGGCALCAIYYTSQEDAEMAEENGGDWSVVDWTPDHYEIY